MDEHNLRKKFQASYLLIPLVFTAITFGLFLVYEKVNTPAHLTISSEKSISIINQTNDYPALKPFFKTLHVDPSSVTRHLKKYPDGRILYDKKYTYDSGGMRLVIGKKAAKRHVVFTGCSFIFGEGLHDYETFSSLLQTPLPELNIYNMGIAGSGPHDLAWLFLHFPFKNYLRSTPGVMIYFFFADHINRSNLFPEYLAWTGSDRPYFSMNSGKLVLKGTIKDSPQWKEYHESKKMGLDKTYLSIKHLNKKITSDHFKLTASLIHLMQSSYLKDNPGSKFYFSFFPVFGTSTEIKEGIEKELKNLGVEILNLSDIEYHFSRLREQGIELAIPSDGHPNEFANQELAKILIPYLKKL